jgi:hypothetical protein
MSYRQKGLLSMITSSARFLTLALAAASLCFLGCGSNDSTNSSATGGTSSNGGATASGGATGKGGATASGGATGKGGATGSGGSATGGITSTGGSSRSCTLDSTTVTSTTYPGGLTLTKACSPYTVDSIVVNDGGVLTIEAGVTVKFSDNTTISVGETGTGKVLINGTAQNQITLTTQYDTPAAGEWYGLDFYSGTASGSQVTYTKIDYAGGNFDGAIVVENALPAGTLTLDHLAIDNNDTADGAVPIMMRDGSTTIACTNCTADGTKLTH